MDWFVMASDDLFLIECDSDRTVSDVEADLIAGGDALSGADLHGDGDIIQLLDPSGRVADTANAFPEDVSGWAGGSAVSHASTERTSPLLNDAPGNWHTNLGLLRFGTDVFGSSVFGMPRYPNSPQLAVLAQDVGVVPARRAPNGDVVIVFPSSTTWSVHPAEWLIVVTCPEPFIAPLHPTFDIVRLVDQRIELRLRSIALPEGRFEVWTRTPAGDVMLSSYAAD